MPSQITGEKAIVSDSKFIPAEQGIEDLCMWKSCIVLREGGPGVRKVRKGFARSKHGIRKLHQGFVRR